MDSDTPARRKAIIERMKHWEPYSESSPVRGLKTALNTIPFSGEKGEYLLHGR